RGLHLWMIHLPQAREQRLFFVSRMPGSCFAEVSQGRFQRLLRFAVEWTLRSPGDSLQRSQKHLDAAMTIREQPRRLRKTVILAANLNRHPTIRITPSRLQKRDRIVNIEDFPRPEWRMRWTRACGPETTLEQVPR